MDIAKSDLVLATAGREKGRLFFVVDVQNEYLLLADGRSRRLEAPQAQEVQASFSAGSRAGGTRRKAQKQRDHTNSELRKALAVYRGEHGNQDQEGSTLWQNPT